MLRFAWTLGMALLLFPGCSGDGGFSDDGGPSSTHGWIPPWDRADAGADGDADGDADPYKPQIVDAEITHPAPQRTGCIRLDEGEGEGDHPALFAIRDQWFAFFTEGISNETAALALRVSVPDPVDFGPPVSLLYGAASIDLVDEGGRLLALASRMLYAVMLESDDGSAWTELGNIAPDEPPYDCEGYPPALFFRSETLIGHLAMGNDYNTGIFGCTDRLFFSTRTDTGWQVPRQVGDGDAVFGFDGEGRLTLVSTFGVYTSTDEGATFDEIPGGDTTATQIRGSGGAWVGGRLVLVQTYNYANENVIAVLMSDDSGASWPLQVVLQRSGGIFGAPVVASDGESLAVAFWAPSGLEVMTSPDRGETWSEPGRFDDPDAGAAADGYSIAILGTRVAVLSSSNGIRFCRGE